MTDTARAIYTASVQQLNGLIAERDALAAALAAKTEQVAGLKAERDALRDMAAELRADNEVRNIIIDDLRATVAKHTKGE